uniref:Protein FAM53A-like n=1 Tax=Phallusia mammillata TaxID=59560 RepID=A0A6F9DD19_9ASCI|nr:protein FAM53A-like [Phallusia mammillata]
MSAVVTQLSFNINEKLRIDDRGFPPFQQHHKPDNPAGPMNKPSTSFSYTPPKEPLGQWVPSPSRGSPGPSSAGQSVSTSVTSASGEHASHAGTSGAVVGVSCQRFTPQRTGVLTRRDLRFSNSLQKAKNVDTTQVTVFDLHEAGKKSTRSTLSAIHTTRSGAVNKISIAVDADNPFQFNGGTSKKTDAVFPSVVGKSCTLHSPKKATFTSGSFQTPLPAGSDIPPIKKHCRSVSEPDETMSALDPLESTGLSSSRRSKVWKPIRQLRSDSRRAQSAFSNSSDCSRSLDCSSATSITGDSLLTPPASPVPRPASVTVIKQESGSWTFLSSYQHHLSGSFPHSNSSFSPLSSPYCNATSPCSSRSNEVASRSWSHSGLSATKRSLSFSDDFEHTESIHYTPSSTPDLERRFERVSSRYGGLLRCQSHPSDLNARRTRSRSRRSHNKLCYQRPNLDFAKMKQTMNKRTKGKEKHNSCNQFLTSGSWPSPNTDCDGAKIPTINPVFPSAIQSSDCSPEELRCHDTHQTPMEQHTPSSSPFMFTIGPNAPGMSHIRDVRGRIPSPTDEVPGEADDPGDMEDTGELATAPGGVSASFMLDCDDLNVDEIENESDDEL